MVSVPALIAIECRVTATTIHMVAQTSTWTSWAHWAFLGSMETHYWASATISRWATVSGSRSALWCSKDLISILRYTGSSSQKFALPSNISSLFFYYYYFFPIHYFSLYFFVFILSNLLVCSPDDTKTLHGMCACTQILHHKCITFETSMFNHNNASLEKWNVIKGDWNFLSRITEKPNTIHYSSQHQEFTAFIMSMKNICTRNISEEKDSVLISLKSFNFVLQIVDLIICHIQHHKTSSSKVSPTIACFFFSIFSFYIETSEMKKYCLSLLLSLLSKELQP